MVDSPKLKAGDKITINGQKYTICSSSDDWTDEDRLEGAKQAAQMMMAYGIEPYAPELREAVGLPVMSVSELVERDIANL